ncbi:hypothetical protein L1049_006175 [Liquidambar formosana]|uniref:Uncharacterized protein n=1 Tax=Liquidambar formosana TaxID=63359 RepID=A0AAP0WR46_LIQFO
MASYLLTLRRPTPSSLFNKLLNPIRSVSIAPSVSRSFNTYYAGEVTFLDANDGTIHHEHRASDHSPIRCSFKMPSYKIHAFNSEARAAIIKEFEDCLIKLPHFFTCHICLRGSPDFLPDSCYLTIPILIFT